MLTQKTKNPTTTAIKPIWHVLYTMSRAEKKVAQQLISQGVEAWCPTQTVIRQWSDRKKTVLKPALPGMILVKEGTYSKEHLFSSKGVLGFMSYKEKRAKVLDKEVTLLAQFLNGKYEVKQNHIRIGDTIDVPVLQHKGKVEKISGNECWVQLANASMTVSFSMR